MAVQLFIGNISFKATEEDVRDFFESRGFAVESVKFITDRETGRSKGFGFVTFPDRTDRQTIIAATHNQELIGRPLAVEMPKQAGDYRRTATASR